MKTSGFLKTLIIAVGFLFFITAGFVSVNVMTSCETQAQCTTCGSQCVGIPGIAGAMLQINAIIFADIADVIFQLTIYMETALAGFQAAIEQKIYEVYNSIDDWFNTFWWYNLRPAMQAMTDQLQTFDDYQDENFKSQADASDANRVNTAFMKHDMDSHREQRPSESVCTAGTVTGSMTRVSTFRRAYESVATAERQPRGANDKSTTAAKGPERDQQDRWSNYMAKYCDPSSNDGFPGTGCAGAATMKQDINVTDTVFMKDTIDLTNPDVQKSVDDLLINIAEPVVKEAVPGNALGSAEGQQEMLKGQAYKAKRQVIYDALYHIVSRRAPGAGGGNSDVETYLQQVRTSAGLDASYFSANPSYNEIMNVMMSERFRTGQYSVEQIDEPENNEREMVTQQAFQAMLMSDELDLLDRYGLVLAAQASGEIKSAKPFDIEEEYKPVR